MRKKLVTFLSLLAVFTLALAACAPGGEEGGTPGAGGTVLPGTDFLETPEETLTVPTEPALTEPVETEPLATEPVITEPVATEPESVPGTGGLNPALVSNLLEFDICDTSDQQLASVNDLVLDFSQDSADMTGTTTSSIGKGQVTYLVAGAGGLLGIGERDILIPWDEVEISRPDMTTGDAAACVVVNVPQEAFNEVPEVDLASIDLEDETWDDELSAYWEGQTSGAGDLGTAMVTESVESVDGTPAATEPVMTEAIETPEPTGTTGMDEGTPGAAGMEGEIPGGTLERAFLASELMGTSVQGINGEDLGAVEDVIIDVEDGRILYLLLSGGELDLGGDLLPVPVNILNEGAEEGVLQLPTDVTRLEGVPTVSIDELMATTETGWDRGIQDFWNNLFAPGTTAPEDSMDTATETVEPSG